MAREFEFKLNVEGLNDLEDTNEELEELQRNYDRVRHELEQTKKGKYKSDLDGMAKALGSMSDNTGKLANNFKTLSTVMTNAIKSITKQVNSLAQVTNTAQVGVRSLLQDYRSAASLANKMFREGSISETQFLKLGKKLDLLGTGKLGIAEYSQLAQKISKVYAKALNDAIDQSIGYTAEQARKLQTDAKIFQNAEDRKAKRQREEEESRQKIENANKKTEASLDRQTRVTEEKVAQEKEITSQKEKQTKEMAKQQEFRTRTEEARAEKTESQKRVAESRERAYQEQEWAAEVARQQKLEKNERARLVLREQMAAIAEGEYQLEDKQAQKLALATSRLMDTARNIRNFAETEGYKGTVGAEATSMLRSSQFYKQIMDYALGWKRVNSEEGKAADTMGRMIVDAKNLQSGINRIHTAFGQISSTVSAIRQIGVEFRKGFTAIAQPLLNIITRVSSSAFKSSLEALKDMELSEIGFGNFYGQSAVPGIMQNIKQEALLSPLSATQLASYVNQIAPLSGGNSQLAINAAMGVAKMIQYSGGEVATEMEYVIKNIRDVIAKGKALTVDIRQFNRAMPALTKVLAQMGETDMLQNGELHIDAKNAGRLLEAFQRLNEFGDVATIFEKTSETISGLMERVQEQVQLMLIDVADFSGFTDLIKKTLHGFLEDENGLLSDMRMHLQFIGRDVVSWIKTRDWERVLEIAKEVMGILWNGLKDSLGVLKSALGGTDWKDTLINLANLISSFIKGIANSYSWLLGIMNGLNNSGILGSGLLQGGMGILGFLSGNAGTLITGGTRSFGNFMGTLNQATFSLISAMERQQAEYLKAATTINTFDEALMIVSQSLTGVSKDILLVDEILGGVLTVEQRRMIQEELEENQTAMAVTAKQAEIVADRASTAATEAETVARQINTQAISSNTAAASSGGLLGPASTGMGTKLGAALSTALRSVLMGSLVGTIASGVTQGLASAFGADEYGAANAGNIVGSVGGFATGGAIIGGMVGHPIIGALVGGLVGGIKGALESSGILGKSREDELNEFKETVNNGQYLKQMLSGIEHGNDISSNEFDNIKANMVKQMNQWAAATPSGTAQMLKDYLTQITINGKNIESYVKEIDKTEDEQAETLWKFIEEGDTVGGNDYANTLKESGLSSYRISAMIMQKALEHGKSRDDVINYLLMWGKSNNAQGEDLTSEMIAGMSEKDRKATQDKLKQAWTEIGMEGVQNLDLNETEKTKLAKGLGGAMAKFLTNAFDDMTEQDWLYMNRFLDTAKVGNVSDQLGFKLSPSALGTLFGSKYYGGDIFDSLRKWASDSKGWMAGEDGHNTSGYFMWGKDFDEIEKILEDEGLNTQERWYWWEDNWKDFVYSTEDLIKIWEQDGEDAKSTRQNAVDELRDIANSVDGIQREGAAWYERLQGVIESDRQFWEEFRNNHSDDDVKTRNKAAGGLIYRAAGGMTPRGVDTVPAMLQPGEFVVRRSTVDKVGLTALNALNTGNVGYFAKALGRQNIYGDYNGAKTWNTNSYDNRKSTRNKVIVNNFTRGARLNRYYSLANRLGA